MAHEKNRYAGTVISAPVRESGGPLALRLRSGAWWLHPAWTAVLVVLPCLIITLITPEDDFQRWWRTPKYFGASDALTITMLLIGFVAGTVVTSFARGRTAGRAATVTHAQSTILVRAGRIFMTLTLAGYAFWALVAISRGYGAGQLQAAVDLRPGALENARAQFFGTVSGVTTLTQFGPLAVVCFLLDRRAGGRRHMVALVTLVLVTLVRTAVYGERLALIEIAIPAAVLVAALAPASGRTRRRWLWASLPLLAPVVLLLFFGAFEYTRSWSSFYAEHSDVGFADFVLRRLDGYYATAGNNSAILLSHFADWLPYPYFTVMSVWKFPILSTWLNADKVFGFDPSGVWLTVLHRYSNPEFNNTGGMLPAVADYGLFGALVWWCVIGLLLGLCYRSLRAGELRGLVLYAVLYVGVLEMDRIFYWGIGRALPAIAGGLIVAALLHRARAREG